MKTLRVGIIGANATRGWARESHVPAVQHLDGLQLVAVANKGQKAAEEAATAFGVSKAYGDAADLIRDPEIDLVTVATTLPTHNALIAQALAAGKTRLLRVSARRRRGRKPGPRGCTANNRFHAAIGLQARANPAVQRGPSPDRLGRHRAAARRQGHLAGRSGLDPRRSKPRPIPRIRRQA